MALIEGVATPGWPTKSGASSNPARPGYVNPTIPGQLTPQPKTALAVLEQFFNACGADLLVAQLETTAGSVAPSVLMIGKKITSLATTEGPSTVVSLLTRPTRAM
jgi:hypothetical protein